MRYFVKGIDSFLGLLLLTDLVFAFLAWLLRPEAYGSVIVFIALFTLLIFALGFWLENRRRRSIRDALERFWEIPDEENKNCLLQAAGKAWEPEVERLYEKLSAQAEQINQKNMELTDYREYIEAWVHEIKTPLSLATLVIHNHREEMSPYVYGRMNHARHQLDENVERILYYARLQADHRDYKFSSIRLDECALEALEEYQAFGEENKVTFETDLHPFVVTTDPKVLRFLLSQLLSNAVKYAAGENARVSVSSWQEENRIYLAVRDNGRGVAPEDAPFLFDKGFTGNYPDRQKATGMGLYLVKKYAEKLCVEIELEPVSTTGRGFGIRLVFQM